MTNQIAQAVVRRDRHIALTGLAAVIFAATLYTINMAGQFNKPMDVALMPTTHSVEPSGHSFLMLFPCGL